ncbi:uncharacterized protein GVI51_M13651 [Nakaseomyces glabratus]|uniref:Ceramide synthase subunit LIP1 n=2 Tax=Candida glabrata TaxID=5478 RepID=LIP1_CANGA|nr:uncharacterized protein CAGL0M13673g [Nakaseomyces glabratus]Q6FIK6.1 RecName: Full=Ceramide synthase subunit LIP1 [Nakaseomyces glabratus CBS 138]KAH7579261.1 hypothetical protein J7297_05285 [Nakaseomyces glabratus]KAH7579883.1 hypothetical protein J7298_05282 [Nakaseomyces glabratus]KAH7580508.1 hypothetical protein J7296_05262 [Nakaseomyces glabratus]KAH7593064.1 hypothetical protein J7295_05277 [Nakaseomyces glabratus]KAH7594135.1 hypothetical protein J7294_05280 [Nakaseomyces glabrat|eukprot:XP_449938.1 uncharacterized protein CAGL0M13673g [[Candida] glabrata]
MSTPYTPAPQIFNLFKVLAVSLALIAAVEYFKYGTRINYEWFHCTPVMERVGGPDSSVLKIWARGGPSCDKRGEYKTILKRISRDYEPNDEHLSFCIKENMSVDPVHYPIHEDKGEPGYIAYVGYDSDKRTVDELCEGTTVFHF